MSTTTGWRRDPNTGQWTPNPTPSPTPAGEFAASTGVGPASGTRSGSAMFTGPTATAGPPPFPAGATAPPMSPADKTRTAWPWIALAIAAVAVVLAGVLISNHSSTSSSASSSGTSSGGSGSSTTSWDTGLGPTDLQTSAYTYYLGTRFNVPTPSYKEEQQYMSDTEQSGWTGGLIACELVRYGAQSPDNAASFLAAAGPTDIATARASIRAGLLDLCPV
ncbi:hypothetical protein LQ327_09460 [Actinomycetospora endophytica]|uniref:DUF732 domain-containing protein n=1 Tax=Actinomycetospora endophytica TaxID=2291215 RepID=A0ABS8P5S3_9PSEU|nr:hypothetical protein [Actinomycetospora endophytica]MCD2193607.1 hypothetical protein [Actinomycetospora endophytica]